MTLNRRIKRSESAQKNFFVFFVSMVFGVFSFLVSLFLMLYCDPMTHVAKLNVLGIILFVDELNICFIFITCVIYILCLLYSYSLNLFAFRFHSFLLVVTHTLLLVAFAVNNLLVFYIAFESLLIPMYLLINIWGSRGRSVHASMLFFFFTFASSILLLTGIFFVYSRVGSLSFIDFMHSGKLNSFESALVLYLFVGGFLAKIPSFPVHIWLPEAHVEASTIGSVILASLFLKLGYYGIYRILPLCSSTAVATHRPVIITVILVSIFYGALVAFRQTDIKKIIAYSSIVHMNFGLIGLFLENREAIRGSVYIMFSHSLLSAAMFFCIGFLYDRFHTRNIMDYGGVVQYMPVFGTLFFLIMIGNAGFPGTSTFIGEWMLYTSMQNYPILVILMLVSTFPTTLFCFWIMTKVLFYQLTGVLRSSLFDIRPVEFYILFILLFFSILFGIFPNLFFSAIFPA